MNLSSYTERYTILSAIFGLFLLIMIAYIGVRLDKFIEKKVYSWQQKRN